MRIAMMALGWLLAAFGTPVSAQVCCPAGCVQDGARCVRTGPTPSACALVACPAGGGSRGAQTSGGRQRVSVPILPIQPRARICTLKGDRPPPGSYRKTCNDVTFRCSNDEDLLLAACKSGRGWIRSELPGASTCADVENRNGRLVCRKLRRYVTEG